MPNHGGGTEESLASILAQWINSPLMTLELQEACGELIAENARFNAWILARKSSFSDVDLWNLAAFASKNVTDCVSAWTNYADSARSGEGQAYAQLLSLLRAQGEGMSSMRESGVVRFSDPDIPAELLEW